MQTLSMAKLALGITKTARTMKSKVIKGYKPLKFCWEESSNINIR